MIGLLDPRHDLRRAGLSIAGSVLTAASAPVLDPKKILVIRPDHLGDLLFLTPALRRIRQGFPNAEIAALVGPWGRPVLERNPDVNRLIVWDFPWFDRKARRSALGPYLSLARLARRLHVEQFDLAMQFRADFWWGALAVRLAGIVDQVGYAAPVTRRLFTRSIPIVHGLHAADENLALATWLTGIGGAEPLRFPIAESERQQAEVLLSVLGSSRPIVALQIGAGAPVKLWPTDRLAAVGSALRDDLGVGIVVIGGSGEAGQVRDVANLLGGDVVALAGATSLGELAAILERCSLAVGPDSGPLHLAVAVGTPTVHLYGPADPRRFGPYGDSTRHRVVQSNRPCAPCNQLTYADNELAAHGCMREIEVSDVLREATVLLSGSVQPRNNR